MVLYFTLFVSHQEEVKTYHISQSNGRIDMVIMAVEIDIGPLMAYAVIGGVSSYTGSVNASLHQKINICRSDISAYSCSFGEKSVA